MAHFSDDFKSGATESGAIVQDVHTGMVVKVAREHIPWFEQARWHNRPDGTPVTHPVTAEEKPVEDKTPAKTGK